MATQDIDKTTDTPPQIGDALGHIRDASKIMSTIGHVSMSDVPKIIADIEVDEAIESANQQASQEKDRRGEELYGMLGDFLLQLPRLVGDRKERTDKHSHTEYSVFENTFASDSLEEIRRLETQVLWLPQECNTKYMPGSSHGSVKTEDPPPFFVIGQKQVEVKDDKSDAVTELLLLSPPRQLGDEPRVARVQVSSKTLELSDEVALDEFRVPLSREEIESHYRSASSKKFILKPPVSDGRAQARVLHFDPYSKVSLVRVSSSPDRQKKRETKHKKHLLGKGFNGVRIDRYGKSKVTMEDIIDFNVPYHTRKLAILLDHEEDYDKAVGVELDKEVARI